MGVNYRDQIIVDEERRFKYITDWLLAEYIPLEPHNSICVQELLRFLTVICNPHDKQNTDIMIHTGLSLLTVALEVGADAISRHPTLLAIVKDTLCRNLLSVCSIFFLKDYFLCTRSEFMFFASFSVTVDA